MADFLFDFCPNTRVAELLAPEEAAPKDFNGWVYHPTPTLPFRPSFKVTLEGLRWYQAPNGNLLTTQNPQHNAGRLEAFYRLHRLSKPFNFQHEYLGMLEMQFASPVNVPKAVKNSGGALEALEITMIQYGVNYNG